MPLNVLLNGSRRDAFRRQGGEDQLSFLATPGNTSFEAVHLFRLLFLHQQKLGRAMTIESHTQRARYPGAEPTQ